MFSSFIFLIIISILIYKLKYYKPLNKFWSKQPVMRIYSNSLGIIGTRPTISITYPNNITLSKTTDIITCYNFVKHNFSQYYNIDYTRFNKHWSNPLSHKFTISNDTHIIGFILCYPINILAYNKNYSFYYVDYLCVHKKYRKHNLATLLISELLMSFSYSQPFLFKKDSNLLPFLPFFSSHYYHKTLCHQSSYHFSIKDSSNVDYDLYNNVLSELKPSFYMNYNNIIGNVLCIYELQYNKLVCNVVWNSTKWKNGNKIVEIDYILSTVNNKDLYNSICQYFYSSNFTDLLIPSISCNMNFINLCNCEIANKLNYYTYNFNLPKIKPSEILFNI